MVHMITSWMPKLNGLEFWCFCYIFVKYFLIEASLLPNFVYSLWWKLIALELKLKKANKFSP